MKTKPKIQAVWMIVVALLACTCRAQMPEERLQRIVQTYADAQQFMGSVLVAKDGKVILSKSYGWADLEWHIPNTPSTRFNIASITKQFTAASILLLEDRGKLKTDDLVKKYLPDAPAAWDKVTIYNLLTHTSGIRDDAAKYEPGAPDRLTFFDKPLDFQPGEQWSYVNMGYLVLGYLLARVSGQTYADFVRENIFKPLGMNDSGLNSNVAIIPRRASGYWPGADGPENAERPNWLAGFSAGALYSTTEDLLQWEEGLFAGKLLTPASLHKLTTPFRNDYACGLYVKRRNGRLLIEHGGNNIGYNSDIAYYPEEKLAVIVLANLNGTVTGKMTEELAAVMHGEPVVVSVRQEIAVPHEVLGRYVGTYQFPGYRMVLTLEGTHLMARFDDGAAIVFFPESETKFFSKAWDMQFEFFKNEKGEFVRVARHGIGGDAQGTKQ